MAINLAYFLHTFFFIAILYLYDTRYQHIILYFAYYNLNKTIHQNYKIDFKFIFFTLNITLLRIVI